MNITVVGAGYVGLVTAAVFSELGNNVHCIDIDKARVENLKKGIVPFFEPSLEEYIRRNSSQKRLFFTTDYKTAVPDSDIVFICVGTPPKENGEANLEYLFSAVEETAKNLHGYTLITIKSTVPIGFEDDLEKIAKKHAKNNFEFASSPEFLREGTAIEDTLNPDRIVIGTKSEKAKKILLDLHAQISGERIFCDIRSAQLIKYAANAFLATKVSYANSIAVLCEKMGADVEKVLAGVGADKRIGKAFFYPGVGYGGSCLPKDVQAFIHIAQRFDYQLPILSAVDTINSDQIERFVNKIREALDSKEGKAENLSGKKIAILGLSFKPNTDDMREAPSIKIIRKLLDLDAHITAYDPQAIETAKKIMPDISYGKSIQDTLNGKDILVLVTEWPEFRELDLKQIKSLLKNPIIVDGRNALDKQEAIKLGFKYFGVGR